MKLQKLANNINIRWNPVTDDGQIRFEFLNFLLHESNSLTSLVDVENVQVHYEKIRDIAFKQIDSGAIVDPVTGSQLPEGLSGAAVMTIFKRFTEVIIRDMEIQAVSDAIAVNWRQDELGVNVADFDIERYYFENSNDPVQSIFVDFGDGSRENL